MDGIKKRPPPKIQEIHIPKRISPPAPYFAKREELYIPKEETMGNLSEQQFKKNSIPRKIVWSILAIFILTLLTYVTFFSWKTLTIIKKINPSSTEQTTFAQDMKTLISPVLPLTNRNILRGEESGRVNILLLGAAGEKKPGGNLTDTILVMSIDTKNKKVAMLSLPRDFYVQIPASTVGGTQTNSFTKINSLYKIGISQQKGTDLISQAVEKITGLTIDYRIAVDFEAFQKIVDSIGGVNIISERDIYDSTYPGPNYSYETFSLKKGAHLLDGATALKYVRERHDDPEGDFGRAKRQQQVIQAVKNKMFSMQTFFNVVTLNNVLSALGENIKTDMSLQDIEQFIKLSKEVDTQNINNVVVDAWKPESLLKVSHVMIGSDRAFILIPRVGNYSEIQDIAMNIFNQAEIKKRQEMIRNEDAIIVFVNQSDDPTLSIKIKDLLSKKMGMKNVREISNSSAEILQTSTIQTTSNSTKIFTLDELIKKLPARIATPDRIDTRSVSGGQSVAGGPAKLDNQSSANDEIVIKLGNDLASVYKYDEDSIEDFNKAQEIDREISNF